uniref:(northern house mosquito) hypothetical protein n=1 Tax=Culex pipiens TaxID=7175 RepID=A0A8D8K1C8_CULPI
MLRDIAMRDRDVAQGPYPPHTSKCLGRMRSTHELLRYANLRSLILVTTAGPADLDTTGLSELPFLEGSRRRRVIFVTFRRIILELNPVAGHVLLLLLVVVQVALLVRLGLRVVHVDRRMLLDLDLVHGFERVGNGGGRRRR